MLPLSLLLLTLLAYPAHASVTIYTSVPGASTSPPQAAPSPSPSPTPYSGPAAFDPTTIAPPAPPNPPQQTNIPITLYAGTDYIPGLSIPQKGNLLGFSIELSVADQILGKSTSAINVEFLNYLENIRLRAGTGAILRVGGNSQDTSTLFSSGLPDGAELDKINLGVGANGVINTPITNYSPDLLYLLSNVSSLVGAQWYFGLAFNDTSNDANALLAAQYVQDILGSNLVALQLGNEPDLYGDHGKRDPSYSIADYMTDFAKVSGDLGNAQSVQRKQTLVGPSICCNWQIGDVLSAGYLSQFGQDLAQVSVQHYPANNCKLSGVISPVDIFPSYLNHTAATSFVEPYLAASPQILGAGKPLVMLETNTASCGGFLGVSDSFGAALWTIDLALQLATANFSTVLLHNSGTSVYYNPVTPPASSAANVKGWNTGSTYYAMLAVAETLGSSGNAQIVDLGIGNNSIYTPAYAIYEQGQPVRMALFNFVDDPSGANDYVANVTLTGAALPGSVNVRYLEAPSVSEKFNITWGGQTMSPALSGQSSDGTLHGTPSTPSITCDPNTNTCSIPMRAPSFALVFLTSASQAESDPQTKSFTASFSPTQTKGSLASGVLQTSNGHGGMDGGQAGSTSRENAAGGSMECAWRMDCVGDFDVRRAVECPGWTMIELLFGGRDVHILHTC